MNQSRVSRPSAKFALHGVWACYRAVALGALTLSIPALSACGSAFETELSERIGHLYEQAALDEGGILKINADQIFFDQSIDEICLLQVGPCTTEDLACVSSRILSNYYNSWDDSDYVYFVAYKADGGVEIDRLHYYNRIVRLRFGQPSNICLSAHELLFQLQPSESENFQLIMIMNIDGIECLDENCGVSDE